LKSKKWFLYFNDESFFLIRCVFDEDKIFSANNWFDLELFVGDWSLLSKFFFEDFKVLFSRKYFIAFWTDCCRILLDFCLFGKKIFDISSLSWATGWEIMFDVSSLFELLLRCERVDDDDDNVLIKLFFGEDFISSRQRWQAKSPLGIVFNGGSQHFGWIPKSQ